MKEAISDEIKISKDSHHLVEKCALDFIYFVL